MHDIFNQLIEMLHKGQRVALVSTFHSQGVNRSLILEEDESQWNKLANGKEGISYSAQDDGIEVIERYSAKPRLIILGCGHIALPLSQFGAKLGFGVIVYDDRPSFANVVRFPEADQVICDRFEELSKNIHITKNDYIIIVTRGHRHDSLCLRSLLKSEADPRYIGMIGSKRRIGIVKQQLEEETGEAEKLSKLHAPIGLAIGAVTPEEIAVSILAEVIQDMRLGSVSEFIGIQFDSANEPASNQHTAHNTNDGKSDILSTNTKKPVQFLSPDMEVLHWLAEPHAESAALVTVIEAKGSTPREAGAKMIVLPHGQIIGSIGGGCAEADVMHVALRIGREGGYAIREIDLTDSAEDEGMVCGGTMKVFIESID